MKSMLQAVSGVVAFAGVMLAGPVQARPIEAPAELRSIAEIATAEPDLSTLVTALKAADLVTTIATTPNLTVFAPTNEAFAQLPAGVLDGLLKDKVALANVLKYHVLNKLVSYEAASSLSETTMLNGETVDLAVESGELFINNARIIKKDIRASNGLIHVIDAVLLPMQTGGAAQ